MNNIIYNSITWSDGMKWNRMEWNRASIRRKESSE